METFSLLLTALTPDNSPEQCSGSTSRNGINVPRLTGVSAKPNEIPLAFIAFYFLAMLLLLPAARAQSSYPSVRMIYLVPSDRQINASYAAAMAEAIRDLQIWYQAHVGQPLSFQLHHPVVEVVATSHPAAWYSTSENGANQSNWFWENALQDGFALTGGGFDDANNRWIYYIDADPACGQTTGGTRGVALLPANDFRGLTGVPRIAVCPGTPPDSGGVQRWVGGLGHELGHAFNLPHPPGCDAGLPNCDARALMWLGYASYPNAHLTAADQQALGASAFFLPCATTIYVDSAAPGAALGTEANPFKTVVEAVDFACVTAAFTEIRITAGRYAGTLVITKPMTLTARGGTVLIGP